MCGDSAHRTGVVPDASRSARDEHVPEVDSAYRFNADVTLALLAVLAAAAFHPAPSQEPTMAARKLTPVLIVDRVEPAAAWWRERLGFEQTIQRAQGGVAPQFLARQLAGRRRTFCFRHRQI